MNLFTNLLRLNSNEMEKKFTSYKNFENIRKSLTIKKDLYKEDLSIQRCHNP